MGAAGAHVPRYVTCWVLFMCLVGVCCRCVLAQTAAPYPPLVPVALLGIWAGNLTSNPIVAGA